MILSCPHCSAVYELPKYLLGAGGAAVRCPHCSSEFTLGKDGEIAAVGPAAGAQGAADVVATSARLRAASPPADGAAPPRGATASREPEAAESAPGVEPPMRAEPATDAMAVARRVLDELAARKGRAMADAGAGGRLLSEFGPDVIAAFEEFRREIGGTGNPAPFREALRERWGIDLGPPS